MSPRLTEKTHRINKIEEKVKALEQTEVNRKKTRATISRCPEPPDKSQRSTPLQVEETINTDWLDLTAGVLLSPDKKAAKRTRLKTNE